MLGIVGVTKIFLVMQTLEKSLSYVPIILKKVDLP
jgi:hypothetical protein